MVLVWPFWAAEGGPSRVNSGTQPSCRRLTDVETSGTVLPSDVQNSCNAWGRDAERCGSHRLGHVNVGAELVQNSDRLRVAELSARQGLSALCVVPGQTPLSRLCGNVDALCAVLRAESQQRGSMDVNVDRRMDRTHPPRGVNIAAELV
jgi:hypothetical protein